MFVGLNRAVDFVKESGGKNKTRSMSGKNKLKALADTMYITIVKDPEGAKRFPHSVHIYSI